MGRKSECYEGDLREKIEKKAWMRGRKKDSQGKRGPGKDAYELQEKAGKNWREGKRRV